jgi:hypothetical protein
MPTSVRWLLSGDFAQFPPIGNCFRGSPVPEGAFERSSLLHSMAGGARTTLTACRRSDTALFEFYRGVVSSALSIQELVAAAAARFSFAGPARWNLVLSHRQRVAINQRLNELWRPAGAIFVKAGASPGHNKAQDMWLWPGLEVYGCVPAESKGVRNGVLYTIESLGEGVRLNGNIKLSMAEAGSWLRLSFAQTYASCQGGEFMGSLRLHDVRHRYFTKTHLYVGLSRATSSLLVAVG